MAVGGSQQETLDPGFVLLGTRQQGVHVILRELVLPSGFDPMSPSFTTVLLYGAETWTTTTTIIKNVQVLINSCLRKILNIGWPDKYQ
ncbi:unnamed protein product [Schistosoma margrebowiei]|uniref:Uncharacterized protein n=1 Tax=Schistosoma margrebowiei TaxID=48269 RepID=A0A183ME47_9TREM|nr:unnamed protein product [Schistosoma margrebowiei]